MPSSCQSTVPLVQRLLGRLICAGSPVTNVLNPGAAHAASLRQIWRGRTG